MSADNSGGDGVRRLTWSNTKAGLLVLSVLLLSLSACSCSLPCVGCPATATVTPPIGPPSGPQGGPGDAVTDQEYRIAVGDQLDIKFFYNPALNEQVVVRPDGRISLQLVPEIVARGLTPAALTKLLTDHYSKELRQPRLTVIVRGFGSQQVYVDGEVGTPGMVPILGPMTALQAISEAGGMTETARSSEVIIIRRGAVNTPLAFQVDLQKARNGTDLSQDISLAPFDIIFVPRSRVANVNVWMDQYIRQNIPIPFAVYYR